MGQSRARPLKMGVIDMRAINKLRGSLYTTARVLGDINAILGGPDKVVKRLTNRLIGRNLIRRMWWR